MRILAGIASAAIIAASPAALAQSYMFDCSPDTWMQAGVAIAMTAEERANWPYRLQIFLDGKSGNACDLNEAVSGCADAPLWSSSKNDAQTTIAFARYRSKTAEPDALLITPAKSTFFGSFDGKAVSGPCRILDFDAAGNAE